MAIQYAEKDKFENQIQEGFVIVDFFSTTCVPCKIFSRVLEEIEAELPFVNIVKVNTTELPEIGEKYEIEAVPTIHFYKNGEKKFVNVGVMNAGQVKEKIKEFMY